MAKPRRKPMPILTAEPAANRAALAGLRDETPKPQPARISVASEIAAYAADIRACLDAGHSLATVAERLSFGGHPLGELQLRRYLSRCARRPAKKGRAKKLAANTASSSENHPSHPADGAPTGTTGSAPSSASKDGQPAAPPAHQEAPAVPVPAPAQRTTIAPPPASLWAARSSNVRPHDGPARDPSHLAPASPTPGPTGPTVAGRDMIRPQSTASPVAGAPQHPTPAPQDRPGAAPMPKSPPATTAMALTMPRAAPAPAPEHGRAAEPSGPSPRDRAVAASIAGGPPGGAIRPSNSAEAQSPNKLDRLF